METSFHSSNDRLSVTVVPRGTQPYAGMTEDLARTEWRTRNAAVDRGAIFVQRAELLLKNHDLVFEGKNLGVVGIASSEKWPRLHSILFRKQVVSDLVKLESARGKSVRQVHEKGQIADLQLRNPQNFSVASDGSVFIEDFETAKDLQEFDDKVQALYVLNDLLLAIDCLARFFAEPAPAYSEMDSSTFKSVVNCFLSAYFSDVKPELVDDLAAQIAEISSTAKERALVSPGIMPAFFKGHVLNDLDSEIRKKCFSKILGIYKQSELNNVFSATEISEEAFEELLIEQHKQCQQIKEDFHLNRLLDRLG
jgi:hypothetical protein